MADMLKSLYHWYQFNKRRLPWRETSDPYRIWISEIILQQTRVNQGKRYYERFMNRFPTLAELARSEKKDVLKIWQGLGYYHRAENIHQAAQQIVEKHQGRFPEEYDDILALKGIGDYTAAAIASIAFHKPYATIDGNINRVLARMFEIREPLHAASGKNIVRRKAVELLDSTYPGMHNQALMELGALICLPSRPLCNQCPVAQECLACKNQTVNQVPAKKTAGKQKNRFFYYFLFEDQDAIYLQKRTKKDIWQNLYELPLIETPNPETPKEMLIMALNQFRITNNTLPEALIYGPVVHLLSHQKIHATFIHIFKKNIPGIIGSPIRIFKKDIAKFAVPRLIEKYLVEKDLIPSS
jgi:A/G-specific adenine glycosylase